MKGIPRLIVYNYRWLANLETNVNMSVQSSRVLDTYKPELLNSNG